MFRGTKTQVMYLISCISELVVFLPSLASAHEVYVLDQSAITAGTALQSPNPFTAYFGNEIDFYLWGFVTLMVFSTILFVSVFRVFEKTMAPFLFTLKKFAHPLVRLTVGACVISFGFFGKLFGTELSFITLFGTASGLAQILFVALGVCIFLGMYTRFIAAIMLGIYAYAGMVFGSYIFTYSDHLGAYILLLILGGGIWSLDNRFDFGMVSKSIGSRVHALSPIAFPLLRVLFGFGLIFAAVYAKFIHSNLALSVVNQYHLTDYFHFDPLFIVLGALIIESLCGLMMFLGIEIRWTSLFLLFWLTLSLLYFQEAVWPHLILFGIGIALFFHGYDRYSLEGRFFKRRGMESVL